MTTSSGPRVDPTAQPDRPTGHTVRRIKVEKLIWQHDEEHARLTGEVIEYGAMHDGHSFVMRRLPSDQWATSCIARISDERRITLTPGQSLDLDRGRLWCEGLREMLDRTTVAELDRDAARGVLDMLVTLREQAENARDRFQAQRNAARAERDEARKALASTQAEHDVAAEDTEALRAELESLKAAGIFQEIFAATGNVLPGSPHVLDEVKALKAAHDKLKAARDNLLADLRRERRSLGTILGVGEDAAWQAIRSKAEELGAQLIEARKVEALRVRLAALIGGERLDSVLLPLSSVVDSVCKQTEALRSGLAEDRRELDELREESDRRQSAEFAEEDRRRDFRHGVMTRLGLPIGQPRAHALKKLDALLESERRALDAVAGLRLTIEELQRGLKEATTERDSLRDELKQALEIAEGLGSERDSLRQVAREAVAERNEAADRLFEATADRDRLQARNNAHGADWCALAKVLGIEGSFKTERLVDLVRKLRTEGNPDVVVRHRIFDVGGLVSNTDFYMERVRESELLVKPGSQWKINPPRPGNRVHLCAGETVTLERSRGRSLVITYDGAARVEIVRTARARTEQSEVDEPDTVSREAFESVRDQLQSQIDHAWGQVKSARSLVGWFLCALEELRPGSVMLSIDSPTQGVERCEGE
jgi:hypothetical protein